MKKDVKLARWDGGFSFSVIIPALNEEKAIARAIASARSADEVVVADGGSTDHTAAIALGLGARVINTPTGRGLQMDEAARLARGLVFVFLHADSTLPEGWRGAISEALGDGEAGGAFSLRIDSKRPFFRAVERMVRMRYRLFGLIYGDQAIFARRDVFFRAGGFGKLPLMEDIDCVKRLRKLGRVILLDEAVVTSARRWESGGVLSNTLRNWLTLLLYLGGVSPEKLYGWYYRKSEPRKERGYGI